MPAAIFFESEGYDTSGCKLMGRHAAGEGFLHACARHARGSDLYCYSATRAQFDDFEQRVAAWSPRRRSHWIPRTNLAALAQPGALQFPGPEIGALAWQRRHTGSRAYAITGVTHTIASHRAMHAIGDLLLAPLQPWDALICTSRAVRAAVQRILADWSEYLDARCGAAPRLHAQLPVIPLGVDCEAADNLPGSEATRAALRSGYGIGSDDVAFLYLGRLSYHAKANPLSMYAALERAARETGKRLHLILAGWYPNEDIRKAFVDGALALCPSVRVVHADGRDPSVRQHVWRAADVFTSLADNIQETFGLTPIEAMAHGLPAVVSDWDGYRDTVRNAVDGFVIPTAMAPAGSGEELALRYMLGEDDYDHYVAGASMAVAVDSEAAVRAYVRLIRDPALRARLGAAGRARARQVYDWRIVIAQYEDLWQELAERRRCAQEVCPRSADAPAHPLQADPFRVFAAYPSSPITERTRIWASPSSTLAQLRSMCRLRIAAVVLDRCATASECDALLQGVASANGILAGALLARFPSDRRALLHRTLAWLAKIGMVRIAQLAAGDIDPGRQQRAGTTLERVK